MSMRTATAYQGDLGTLFCILSPRSMILEVHCHLDEPEVYANYPQHVVIGWTWYDSCSTGLAASMLRNLHIGHAACH